jgi:hypothetical protein
MKKLLKEFEDVNSDALLIRNSPTGYAQQMLIFPDNLLKHLIVRGE